MHTTKSFEISKQVVWSAYKRVKANKGAAGVDAVTMTRFEEDLKGNLYKLWNRLSSGCYFPPAVKVVAIPKATGGVRQLGIPTVSDRIAQMVVKMYFEPRVEPVFHQDSYGYRPNKSALGAVGKARQRCWQHDWVVDLDIKGFFDNLDHDLVMRAVLKHSDNKWVPLYIERWLKAPAQMEDGSIVPRNKGTAQGGVISPLISNLFLHYAFDKWMERNFPENPFERYADDMLIHCKTKEEALKLNQAIGVRLLVCGLELHPEKTKIVYCKDDDRPGKYDNESFDFLGYTFRARKVKARSGRYFTGFNPAISQKASKAIRKRIKGWKFHRWTDKTIFEMAAISRSILRGWENYYGKYYKSAFYSVLRYLDIKLITWVKRKYKRLKGSTRRAAMWLRKVAKCNQNLFPHWCRTAGR